MKVKKSTVQKITAITHGSHTKNGHETCDPHPYKPTVLKSRELSLTAQIQNILRNELSRQAEDQGYESFEDANDFEVENEYDKSMTRTTYEELMDEDVSLAPEKEIIENNQELTPNPDSEVVLPRQGQVDSETDQALPEKKDAITET